MFDTTVMLFFLMLSSIHFVCFLLFVLICFIYNIYRTTYLCEIIFPCMKHNESSFFLFQYLTNYLSLRLRTNENNERREHCSRLKGQQPFACAVTQIPLLSLQCCRDFQTRKFYVNYIEHVKVFENNITW